MRLRARSLVTAALATSLLAAGGAQAEAATAAPQQKTGVVQVVKTKAGTLTVSIEKIGSSSAADTAGSSVMHPMTAVNCRDDNPIFTKHMTCFGIYGSGNYVSSMDTTTANKTGYAIKMNADIQTGRGAVMVSAGWVSVQSGYEIHATWTVEGNIQDTTYCGGGFGNDGYTDYVCEPITG